MTQLAMQDGALLFCDRSLSSECCEPEPPLCACNIVTYVATLRYTFAQINCDTTISVELVQHPQPTQGWFTLFNGCFWDNRNETGDSTPCAGTCELPYVYMIATGLPLSVIRVGLQFFPGSDRFQQTGAALLSTTEFCPDNQSVPEQSGSGFSQECDSHVFGANFQGWTLKISSLTQK